MGSGGGVVGHGGDRGKAALSHDVHGPTGMLVDCGVHEGDGADILGKLSPAPRTHMDREGWLRDYMSVCIHIQGYSAH